MDLFDQAMQESMSQEAPLAARMRPRTFAEFVGQEHIIGPGKLLRRAIEADRLFSSIILCGPPGTGKTTLAQMIAAHTKAQFESISAVLAGVAELRRLIEAATERRRLYHQRTILLSMKSIAGIKLSRTLCCPGGKRHAYPHWRHHRKPLFRRDSRPGIPLAGLFTRTPQ